MSNKKHHIIAYHGWGFDDEIWKPLKAELEPHCTFTAANRGYFSKQSLPSWDENPKTEKLLLLHSWGLHWCSEEIIQQADHLVLVGSFLKFHPTAKKEHKRSKLFLRKMQAQFVDSPQTVLEKFYEDVFYPDEVKLEIPENLNHDLLLSDLGDLDRDYRENAGLFNTNSITILHGSNDQIVNNELARKMYSKLRLRSQYFEIKNGGHALPFTHSSKIFEILNSLHFIK